MQRLCLNKQGWVDGIRHCPSPFVNKRPNDVNIDLLVLHNISLPPNQFGTECIDALFCGKLSAYRGLDPFVDSIMDLNVSAHFLIDREGRITQYASTLDRAWHAGDSSFAGKHGCNDFSIGIELNGSDHIPYTWRQYHGLITLTLAIIKCHPQITPQRITTHQHIAPQRKSDPGPAFNHCYFQRWLQQELCKTA